MGPKELDSTADRLKAAEKWEAKHKVVLYMTEWLYFRFKARCEKRGIAPSAVIEEWMRQAVEGEPDRALDKKAEEEFLKRLRSR